MLGAHKLSEGKKVCLSQKVIAIVCFEFQFRLKKLA